MVSRLVVMLSKWRDVRLPLVHAAAHIRVHRHEEVANQYLLVFQRFRSGPLQREIGGGWNPTRAGGQTDCSASKF